MIRLAKFRKFLKLLFDHEVPTTNEPVKKPHGLMIVAQVMSRTCEITDLLPLQSGRFFFLTIQPPVRHDPSETT